MPCLTREQILNADDRKREEVDMNPFGWPGSVWVQNITGLERGKFEEAMQDKGSFPKFRALLLVYCIVNDDGKRLFNSESDVDALNTKNAAALDHLYDKAQKLCGWRKADIDDLTKNLSTGQSDDSTTA
jgi:hypothetical protein